MTLTIQDVGALGELLGSVGVLATIVYLSLQTRQNTQAIGAQLDSTVIAARLTTFLSVATSTELGEAVREDRLDETPISKLDADSSRPSTKPGRREHSACCSPPPVVSRASGKASSRPYSPSSSSSSRSNARRPNGQQ